jgi:tRNA threonylcarbamoyladenosine biosynthesis protein TsaB
VTADSAILKGAMLVLALDTTTHGGSLAVLDDDRLLAELAGDAGQTHTERLPDEIAQVLALAGVSRDAVDLFVVASGPGAFTGLRIGLAVVQGLALVLDRPAIGVSALDAVALTAREMPAAPPSVAVWRDAARGEVFGAVYLWPEGGSADPAPLAGPPVVGTPGRLLADWEPSLPEGTLFAGDGARRYADIITTGGRFEVGPHAPLLAGPLGRIGRARALAGQSGPPHALQPLYVRRPDVELERERRAGLIVPTP